MIAMLLIVAWKSRSPISVHTAAHDWKNVAFFFILQLFIFS